MQDITQAMEALNEVYTEVLELGGQKKQLIVRNDVDGLTKLMNKESRLVKQTVELEQGRIEAVRGYLQEKNLRLPATITLTELTRVVFNIEDKQQLHHVHQMLLDTMMKLKELNELNQQLIEQSLAFINYSLDILVGPDDEPVYHNPANQHQTPMRSGMFDTRA
jgi:flagellar biosynthesis/type III secretory pathway chaperone